MSEDLFSNLDSSVPRIAHLENNSYIYGCLPSFQTGELASRENSQFFSSKILQEHNLNERICLDRSSSPNRFSADLEDRLSSDSENLESHLENFQKRIVEKIENKIQNSKREESFRGKVESIKQQVDCSYQHSLIDRFSEIQGQSPKDNSPSKDFSKDRSGFTSCEPSYVFSEANFHSESLNHKVPMLQLKQNDYSPSMQENISPVNESSAKIQQEIDWQIKMKEKKTPKLKPNWSNLEKPKKHQRKKSLARNSKKRCSFNKSPYAKKSRPAKPRTRKSSMFLPPRSPLRTKKPKDQFVNKLISIIGEHSKHCSSLRAQVDVLRTEYSSVLF